MTENVLIASIIVGGGVAAFALWMFKDKIGSVIFSADEKGMKAEIHRHQDSGVTISGTTQYVINYLGLSYHYNALGRGLIDSRNVLYLLSVIFLMLFLTKLRLSSKKN